MSNFLGFLPISSKMNKIKAFLRTYWVWIALGIGFLLGTYRLIYFMHSNIPLGYDPGMYKWIFTAYMHMLPGLNFATLPSWIRHEPLLWLIMWVIGKLWGNFDWRLTRWIWLINIIPGFLIFLLLKKEHKRTWVLAAWLYWTSITQYQLFWWWYFKQAIAVNLLLLILIAIQNKKLLWQGILFFLLIVLHKHTALYAGAIIGCSFLWEIRTTKTIPRKRIGILFGVWILALLCYIPLRNQIMPEAVKAASSTFAWIGTGWDFITRVQYIRFEWLIILFSIFWFYKKIKNNSFDLLCIWYIIGIIWVILGIVNFNRTLVFLDIFVVILAWYGLYEIYRKHKLFWLYAIGLIVISTGINYIKHIETNAQWLINSQEFAAIKNIPNITEANAIIMTTHKNYTPWMMWRSERDYINPWMAELDKRDHAKRIQRWANNNIQKCTMLESSYKTLHRPLYIWQWSQQASENISAENCFQLYATWTSRQMRKIKF